MSPQFWRGRRIFITGHTGFKGAWLSLWLNATGAQVAGYSLAPPTNPSLWSAAALENEIESTIGDVRDAATLDAALSAFAPEIVFHLAAQPLVRRSYEDPIGTYSTNVMGVVHLLEAARKAPSVQAVVVVTTDKCYENHGWPWGYRESDTLGGHDPYSSSKGCAELVTAAYMASYFPPELHAAHGVAIATARAGNVIGGGDWAADRLIPDAVRALGSGHSVRVRSPYAVRPWQHVLEPLRGYLDLAEALVEKGPAFNGGWNFGPRDEDARPVSWIMDRIVDAWGDGAAWELDGEPQPHEAQTLRLDCSKARERLGWQPALGLADALTHTIDWYREFYRVQESSAAVRRLARCELSRYEELTGCRIR